MGKGPPKQRVKFEDGRLGYMSATHGMFVPAVNFVFAICCFVRAPRYNAIALDINVNGKFLFLFIS